MRNTFILYMLGAVLVLLLVGAFFYQTGGGLPIVEQVSNPEASVTNASGDKGAQLAALIVVVLAIIPGMAVALYGALWALNREVTRAQQQPEQPFELLSFRTEGNTTGALVNNNILFIVIGVGVLMMAAVIAALVLA